MIKFYKGLKANYNEQIHKDDLFFTTDTYEILVGGESYGKNANGNASITEDIIVAGGPLADDLNDIWPEGWTNDDGNKIIPAGKSILEIFQGLFLKTINGTVEWDLKATWNPSLDKPTVTLSSEGPLEVGSTVTCIVTPNSNVSGNKRSATCKASEGYFTSLDGSYNNGNYTISVNGTIEGSVKLAYTWNGVSLTEFVSGSTELKIASGINKFVANQSGVEASVEALPETTVYASTNTKQILENVKDTFTDITPENKQLSGSNFDTIEGYYRYFIGECDIITEDTLTSDLVRSLAKTGVMTTSQISYTVNHNPNKGFIVACPATYNIDMISDGSSPYEGGFDVKTMNVKDAGDSDVSYKVYYCNNKGSNSSTYKIFKFK